MAARTSSPVQSSPVLSLRMRGFLAAASLTLFSLLLLTAFLSPFSYMAATAFKDNDQITDPTSPLWPGRPAVYVHKGEAVTYSFTYKEKEDSVTLNPGDEFDLHSVPDENGNMRSWALIVKRRGVSFFVDPGNPEAGLIEWEGEWRTLEPAYQLSLRWENFIKAWNDLEFLQVLRNTLFIAIGGDIGTLLSCTLVAYGFSRFRIPGKDIFLVMLVSTIILPGFVTLIPTYALFQRLGWVGTYAPLIVPHFFANAYNVFLLRQYFLTIPKEMDEAAMMDGASPLRTLISVILPQSMPVVVAVGVFHFIFAWNDYFGPLIYLSTKPDLQPLSVAIQYYNQQYVRQLFMVQATAMLGLVVPVVIFFIAQRAFMRGVVVTGVEK
jgi:multiple sugar transport system permease protein